MERRMENDKINILLLEDNPAQYTLLKAYLEKEFSRITHADSITDFRRHLEQETPDLVLLDLNLPDGDGLDLVGELKIRRKVPVIIITSRDTVMDRLTGLELGADDYICKPYHPRELVIRINKLLQTGAVRRETLNSPVRLGPYTFDRTLHRFLDHQNREISLTPGEYLIITSLIDGAGMVLSRSQLLNTAFQRIEYPSDRTIDVLVSRLRKKFPVEQGEKEIIETVKGFGYRLNPGVLQ